MEKNKLHILEEGVDGIVEPCIMGNLCHMENLEVKTSRPHSYTKYMYVLDFVVSIPKNSSRHGRGDLGLPIVVLNVVK